ncbi:hypothetical protein CRUP_026696 [Coryphaenoides rupestris]|nr:hypothetical protein CRUP_026696 [Coryphaenoides rupestris]
MVKEFLKSLKKSKEVTPAAKVSGLQRRPALPTRQASLSLASACRHVSFPRVDVEVLGCCSSDVAKAKQLVDDLVTSELKQTKICSPHLPLLLDTDKQDIVALSQSLQVCVTATAPDTVTVSGKAEDALTVARQIEKHLQIAKELASRREEEKRLRETVRWEVSDGETWVELDQSLSLDLEHALHRKERSIRYTRQQQTYTVNLDKMERTDSIGTITTINRTLKANSETGHFKSPYRIYITDTVISDAGAYPEYLISFKKA